MPAPRLDSDGGCESRAMRVSEAIFRGSRPCFPLPRPPSLSLIQCMELRFESWRGSLWEGGGTRFSGLTGATGRQGNAIAAIWDREQREKIYNFIETRRRMFVFAVKMQSKATKAFSGATSGRFGARTAISEAFVLGRSGDEGGQELQSMAAACALTAWRPRERLLTPQRTAARTRKRRFKGRVRAGKYSL